MMFLGLTAGVWVVLVVGGLIGIALVAVLNKMEGKISDNGALRIESVAAFLKSQEKLLESLLGEKYAPIYKAILDALKSLADKKVTEEEAVTVVNGTLSAALKVSDIELTEEQRKVVDAVVEAVVGMLINEPTASAQALSLI